MPKEIKDINDLVIELTMELCQKSPAAEKALSTSTLVGGIDFSTIRILSKAGGSFPVASKLANCRLISGSTPVEDWKEGTMVQKTMEMGHQILHYPTSLGASE